MVASAAAASTVFALADEVPARAPHPVPEPSDETAAPTAYDRWNDRMETPLIVAAVLFVVVLCLPVLATGLPAPVRTALRIANVGIWLFFTVDYVGRLVLSEDRWRFVRTHLLDLVIVLVPFFRPLRLVRLMSVAGKVGRRSRGGLVADVTKLVTVSAFGTAFLGAVLALDAERDAPDTTLPNFADALWWALGTMTAVPYGDVYPVTQEGRLISAALMILGLVFVGLITAAIAAWFVQYIGAEEEDALAGAREELQAVEGRLAAMEALLRELSAPPVPVAAVPRQRRAPAKAADAPATGKKAPVRPRPPRTS